MNDIELKEYFHRNRPQTSDETTYMAGLSAKMNAAAEIKRMHDASIRKNRRICAATFAVGCCFGMAVSAFILLRPISVHQFMTDILASFYLFVFEWKMVIILSIAVASLILGLIPWRKGFICSSFYRK